MNKLQSTLNKYFEIPRYYKKYILIIIDFIICSVSIYTAMVLREGNLLIPNYIELLAMLVFPIATFVVFYVFKLYTVIIRYLNLETQFKLLKFHILAVIISVLVLKMFDDDSIYRSSILIYSLITFTLLIYYRLLIRYFIQKQIRSTDVNCMIYGANKLGAHLVQSLSSANYQIIGFIGETKDIINSNISGYKVYSLEKAKKLIENYKIDEIIIAYSNKDIKKRAVAIQNISNLNVKARVLNDIFNTSTNNNINLDNLREVNIEDLIGRETVIPETALLKKNISNKKVLITGAGGSIGSELATQVYQLKPSELVLVDHSEYNLFKVTSQLKQIQFENQDLIDFSSLLLNIANKESIEHLFKTHKFDTVYHAAAYKHVAIVEDNIIAGIKNNVFSTLYLTQAVIENKIKHYVLISTDKAVNPENYMGMSKRIAELIVQALTQKSKTTQSTIVRFGNVIGSSGSVLQIFNEQIEKKLPVTITHTEATRYFMSIQEAVELVIQASAMSQGGQIFLLDMGQPMKIIDLAKKLIKLKGLSIKNEENLEGDIELKIIGLKSGEKMHEVLTTSDDIKGTDHKKIMQVNEKGKDWQDLEQDINALDSYLNQFDEKQVKKLVNKIIQNNTTPRVT